jgi:sugar phosphate isomerase/epimerase
MTDWPVGLSTGCFYDQNILDCLEPIRKGGFCMLEICSFVKHLDFHDKNAVQKATDMMHTLGMEAYSFHAPFANDIDITAFDRQQRKLSINEILSAAQSAAMMQVRYFVIHPGPEKTIQSGTQEHLQRLKNATDSLNLIARECNNLGMRLCLENMLPHLLSGNTSDMLWIIGAINEITAGTCLDTGHANLSKNLHTIVHKLSGHLHMIHANDNRSQYDDHRPPGQGDIDWEQLLKELHITGFTGGLILELAAQEEKTRDQLLAEAREARGFLRNIGRKLDLHI